jgi:hypothetical protein
LIFLALAGDSTITNPLSLFCFATELSPRSARRVGGVLEVGCWPCHTWQHG